jgi:BNR/Asp-box repeat protein
MSDRLLVATRKGLFTLERNGSALHPQWKIAQVSFLGDHIPMAMADPRDGALYAALEHGHFGTKLHRSNDGGATWQEIPAPTYPEPKSQEEVAIDPMRNKPIEWKLEKIWALETGGPNEPGLLWCGTIPGGLFRSTDHGQSWALVRSLWDNPKRKGWFGGGADLPGIHSICVHPQNSKQVAVAISCGGVWVTTDGGETWNLQAQGMWAAYMPPELKDDPNIQDVHRLVQCRTQPDGYWAQHHNGVFRSTDGAKSWQDVTNVQPSVFGFAVAVHPEDANTAWLVPAIKDERRIPVEGKVVVSRTRDGGQSFEVLRNGLPQEHAYDLVFRHGLDIDSTGDRLAFGTTTGSLWVTEDQGDTWHTISTHLPPIYCVRFMK